MRGRMHPHPERVIYGKDTLELQPKAAFTRVFAS
jgi:hypothetical protein